MAKPKRSGLGRGLETLIPNSLGIDEEKEKQINIKIIEIEPNKSQPRKDFDEAALESLAESISQVGVIAPIVVQKRDGYYEIIAGERRWRAAKKVGLKEIPAVVKDYSEEDLFAIALIENIQRENLNPIEEAAAYKKMMDEFSLTQDEVAKKVSKSRTAIANFVRLLKLDEEVQKLVSEGKLTYGHARALINISNKKTQLALANKIISGRLSVRETENLVKKYSADKGNSKKKDRKSVV